MYNASRRECRTKCRAISTRAIAYLTSFASERDEEGGGRGGGEGGIGRQWNNREVSDLLFIFVYNSLANNREVSDLLFIFVYNSLVRS